MKIHRPLILFSFLLLLAGHVLYAQGVVSILAAAPPKGNTAKPVLDAASGQGYLWAGNMLLVQVAIEHEVKTLLFDTGAPGLVLNEQRPSTPTETANSLNGSVETGQLLVRNLTWNALKWPVVAALSLNLNHLNKYAGREVDGLLGMDMLKGLVFYFNPQSQSFYSWSQSQFRKAYSADPLRRIELKYAAHLPLIPLEINGHTRWFILDTGAGHSIIDADLLQGMNQTSPLDSAESVAIEALNQVTTRLSTVRITEVALGGIPLPAVSFLASDLSNIKQQVESPEPIAGIIGMDVLRTLHCALNLKDNSLLLY